MRANDCPPVEVRFYAKTQRRALIDEWDDDGDCALLYGGDAARKIRAALEGEYRARKNYGEA